MWERCRWSGTDGACWRVGIVLHVHTNQHFEPPEALCILEGLQLIGLLEQSIVECVPIQHLG